MSVKLKDVNFLLLYFFPKYFALNVLVCAKLFIIFCFYIVVQCWRVIICKLFCRLFSGINLLQKRLIPAGTASLTAFSGRGHWKHIFLLYVRHSDLSAPQRHFCGRSSVLISMPVLGKIICYIFIILFSQFHAVNYWHPLIDWGH